MFGRATALFPKFTLGVVTAFVCCVYESPNSPVAMLCRSGYFLEFGQERKGHDRLSVTPWMANLVEASP